MKRQRDEQIDGAASAEAKAEWIRPELARLDAGAAEQGDLTDPDGNINS